MVDDALIEFRVPDELSRDPPFMDILGFHGCQVNASRDSTKESVFPWISLTYAQSADLQTRESMIVEI